MTCVKGVWQVDEKSFKNISNLYVSVGTQFADTFLRDEVGTFLNIIKRMLIEQANGLDKRERMLVWVQTTRRVKYSENNWAFSAAQFLKIDETLKLMDQREVSEVDCDDQMKDVRKIAADISKGIKITDSNSEEYQFKTRKQLLWKRRK